MSRIGIVGGAYESQAYSADAQKCVNLMVEKEESGAGKSDLILVNTPGLSPFMTLPDTPFRGGYTVSTPGVAVRAFAVSGSTLFEILSGGTAVNLGNVGNDGKPASFASSNIQLMVASNGQGFCLTLATNVLTGPIATIAGVVQVAYCKSFFAALIGNSAKWFASPALDGINWDPASVAIISDFADNVVTMIVLGQYVCFLGVKKSECYYASGNVFPFDVAPGGFSDQGSAATFGIVQADNTLFGIWGDPLGGGVAFRLNGTTFQRISTHAIENEWQNYSTIADAVCFSYQDRGHTIIQWTFPTADKTWCYDVSTGLWHQKTSFVNGVERAHLAQFHMYAFGKHLVGGSKSGTIYQMSQPTTSDGGATWNFVTDAGNVTRRVRRSPYIGQAHVWNFIDEFELMADTGLGPNIPLQDGSGNSRGPLVMVRISKDGGHNWIDRAPMDMGQLGKFGKRLLSYRFSGKFWGSNGLIIELSFTDAAPFRIIDADVTGTPDLVPQKRISQQLRERA